MSPRERLHEFLVDVMKALGHSPAVFIGQDERLEVDQFAPVIVYAPEASDDVDTFEGSMSLADIYTVQIASRTATAAEEVDALVEMIRTRLGASEDGSVVRTEGDRDDDLSMIYATLEVSISTEPGAEALHQSATGGTRLIYGPPADPARIIYGRGALVW